jgi:hypothetical protein
MQAEYCCKCTYDFVQNENQKVFLCFSLTNYRKYDNINDEIKAIKKAVTGTSSMASMTFRESAVGASR